jgi:uncharacterized protein (DUF1800 family)
MAAAATIALNRFGLGARLSETPPADPRGNLLNQLRSYQPRPAALASMPSRAEIAAQIGDYIDEVRPERQMRRQAARMPAMKREQMGDEEIPENARRFIRRSIVEQYMVMVAGRMNAAATSNAPFAERLVHFWANHFAVSADKPQVIGMAGLLEFEAIRPNLMGRFADMLLAVEQHPAMLMYLDQWHSIGPDSQAAKWAAKRRGQKRGINENLAREIMELHTLGVDGGYSQGDVTELARALTGWTVAGLVKGPAARALNGNAATGSFNFAELVHQPGDRIIMGRRYGQQGEGQARASLLDLAAHPSTARHLATKLARHFAGDEPSKAMIDRLAAAYMKSAGDLPSVYRAIIDSPEAWMAQTVKFKTPWEWTVSAFRMAGAAEVDGQMVAGLLKQLGQPTWTPGSPAGWDDKAASWAGPNALVRRVEAAEKIAAQAGAGTDARAVASRLFGETLTQSTAQAIARAESPQQGLALLLVSPEFLRR